MPYDETPQPYDVAEASDVPQMPWEQRDLSLRTRVWASLASTFHPARDVARVCHGGIGPALRFSLVTAVPIMLLAGIIPFTRRVWFGSQFTVSFSSEQALQGAADASAGAPAFATLAFDVLTAAGVGAAVLIGSFLFCSWNYVALARFVADPALSPVAPTAAAWRVSLYRAWLLPAAMGLFYLAAWAGPEPNAARAELLHLAFMVAPGVVQMLQFSATARYLGASPLAAVPVAFVPVFIYGLALGMGFHALTEVGYLPSPPPPSTP